MLYSRNYCKMKYFDHNSIHVVLKLLIQSLLNDEAKCWDFFSPKLFKQASKIIMRATMHLFRACWLAEATWHIATITQCWLVVSSCAFYFLIISFLHNVVARIKSRYVVKAKHVLQMCEFFLMALEKLHSHCSTYRKISNTRRTKSLNLNVSPLGLQVSLRNILKPSVGWRMKM